MLYVTWFVHLGSIVTDYAWLVYGVIPLYAIYTLYVKLIRPYWQSYKEQASIEPTKSRRMEKREKQQNKVRYQHVGR